MAKSAAEASEQLLKLIKTTGLDFKIIETPFSLDIQIKKKFIKYNSGTGSHGFKLSHDVESSSRNVDYRK